MSPPQWGSFTVGMQHIKGEGDAGGGRGAPLPPTGCNLAQARMRRPREEGSMGSTGYFPLGFPFSLSWASEGWMGRGACYLSTGYPG